MIILCDKFGTQKSCSCETSSQSHTASSCSCKFHSVVIPNPHVRHSSWSLLGKSLKRLIPHYPCNLVPRLLLVSKHYNLCVRFRPYSMSGTFILGGNNGELTALNDTFFELLYTEIKKVLARYQSCS